MAIQQALNPPTNYGINKLSGQMGPQVTGQLEGLAGSTPEGTDLSQLSTGVLEQLIPQEGSALAQYYNPVGAGMGTSTSSTAMSRYLQGLQNTDPAASQQVSQSLQTDQSSMLRAIAQLQQRGVDPSAIGGLMGPQLNSIWNMYNSDLVDVPANGYVSPTFLKQGLAGYNPVESQQQLADVYGGPTWLALNQMYGPQLAGILGQYGINAPGMNYGGLTQPAQPAPLSVPAGQAEGYIYTGGDWSA